MKQNKNLCPECKGSGVNPIFMFDCDLCGGTGKKSDGVARLLSGEVVWLDGGGPFIGRWVEAKSFNPDVPF